MARGSQRANGEAAPRRTVAQQRLARIMKAAREAKNFTQDEVGEALGKYWSTISKMENGHVFIKLADVRAMALLYGMSDTATQEAVNLAIGAKTPGWTAKHSDIPDEMSMLADFENAAAQIFAYDELMLSGLLQTEETAWHVIDLATDVPRTVRESRFNFRMERQEQLFRRSNPPELRFVLHEATLRSRLGSPRAMERQLEHLGKLATTPGVEIRVWPFENGPHAWMSGAFTVLKSSDETAPHVVYTESQLEARYLDDPDQVNTFMDVFTQLRQKALPFKEFAP